jgi:adenylosuccinate lyase
MAALPAAQLEAMFDLAYHTKHVDTIFERVFAERDDYPQPDD